MPNPERSFELLRADTVESLGAARRLQIAEYEQAGRKFWHNSKYRPICQRQRQIRRRQNVVRPVRCAGEGEFLAKIGGSITYPRTVIS